MNGRERILALLDGRPVDRPPLMPITMMFAARQIGARYRDYVDDPQVLAEAQIRTAEEFGFDHVSCISDPAREAADCGAELLYFEDEPPSLNESKPFLMLPVQLATLKMPDPHSGERMSQRIEAVSLLKEKVGKELLVEGWIEGPIAEAADLRGLNALLIDFYDDPQFVRDLMQFCTELALRFAKAQLEAGADIIGVGDAAASLVGPRIYENFVWPYEKQLVLALRSMGARVRLHICGNTSAILEKMGELGCDIVDLDYFADMAEARRVMPDQVLLGNLNPVSIVRDASSETVRAELETCHRAAGEKYVAGAGCEIPRDTPAANVRAFAEYLRSAPVGVA